MIALRRIAGFFADLSSRDQAARNTSALGLICLAVLCVILSLGLWPFHVPRNDVTWLKGANGLSFGRFGTVTSSEALKPLSSTDEICCSLEVWAQPHPNQNSATLLSFYTRENSYQLRLRQSLVDFRLQIEIPNGTETDFFVPELFRHEKPVFITITTGREGTAVYAAGALAGRAARLRIPEKAFASRILLGDSPFVPDGWYGQVRGLAIYDSQLTARQVLRHYDAWTKSGSPEIIEDERPIALYLFDEHSGSVVHSNLESGVDLHISEKYFVVDKLFMEPLWREFSMSRDYWAAVLKNIVGFVPLGLCFYPYLSARHGNRATVQTIAFGAMVSLTIEILQWFLPTRDSGMTDVITNTLGTWIGVLLYRLTHTILVERFRWLPLSRRSSVATSLNIL